MVHIFVKEKMKKGIKKHCNKFIRWWNETPEEKEEKKEDEEYKKFIRKVESRMDNIEAAQSASTPEGRAQVALMFENAYTQKKITEANKTMGKATIVLAIATIALVITNAYGASGLENAVVELVKGFLGVIIIIAVLWVVGAFAWIIKFFWKIFRKKRKV